MAIKVTGFAPRTEWIDSAWCMDPAVEWGCDIEGEHGPCADCQAKTDYLATGEKRYLRIKEGQEPTPIRFRVLTRREVMWIDDIVRTASRPPPLEGESEQDYRMRWAMLYGSASCLRWFWAAAVGLDFPGVPVARELVHDMRVLSGEVLDGLAAEHGQTFLDSYGRWIWDRSQMTEDQKKASSSDTTTATPGTLTVTPRDSAAAKTESDGSGCSDAPTSPGPNSASPPP